MTRWGTASRGTAGGQIDWHAARELLKSGQYDRVVELLRAAQEAIEQTGDGVLADTLSAAMQICLACSQCKAETKWHRQALKAADQREHELRQQLQTILNLFSEKKGPAVDETRDTSAGTFPVITSPLEGRTPESPRSQGFWQRIQNLLGRGASHRPPKRDTPDVSADAPTPSFVERVQPLTASLPMPEGEPAPASADEKKTQIKRGPPVLVIYCLGPFRVYQDDQPVEEWPSSKGKAIFKYLITHRERPAGKEVLMELFWPGAHPDAARNNLNVAIYGLRQALRETRPDFSHVAFHDDSYLLNPDLKIWVDCEAFTEHYAAAQALKRRGDVMGEVREYRAAEALYEGDFLEDDRYEDWIIPKRQRLRDNYLSLLDHLCRYYLDEGDDGACATLCHKMLAVDPCREEAHRHLMRCYSRQGQHYLALRQYHFCIEALKEELGVGPESATTQLYERIRRDMTV